jgi:hypothetical protein
VLDLVVREFPNMSAVVIDSKPVCQIAAEYIQQSNLQDKMHTQPIDFLKEELPKDCDVAFLSHILHLSTGQTVQLFGYKFG